MKFLSLFIFLLAVISFVNAQQEPFDYERFLRVFSLKFDYDRFLLTFFSKTARNSNQPAFDYDQSLKTFFAPKEITPEPVVKKNLSVEPEDPEDNFDMDAFKKAFNLECNGECQKDFSYKKFMDAFNSESRDENFDIEKFLKEFNMKISSKAFEWNRFAQTFLLPSSQPGFDYERFFKTFFGEKEVQSGGAVRIAEGISNGV